MNLYFWLAFKKSKRTANAFENLTKQEQNILALILENKSNREIDYGTINQNAYGERTFKFINTGEAPIVIMQVKTSCGCTVPSYSKTPIL